MMIVIYTRIIWLNQFSVSDLYKSDTVKKNYVVFTIYLEKKYFFFMFY